ncbi:hypothetical protein AwDysgo_17680 [Bacteroidales bacterium]|nr:hypothetical protein AwDysgo_17680 [Bacteroidales bacterium]
MEIFKEDFRLSAYTFKDNVLCFLFAFMGLLNMRVYLLWENYFALFYSLTFGLILFLLAFNFNKYVDFKLLKYTIIYFMIEIGALLFTKLFYPEREIIFFVFLFLSISSLFLCIGNKYKFKSLQFLLNITSFIFLFGIIEYFLIMFGLVGASGVVSNEKDYIYYTYTFNVIPEFEVVGTFYRFCSLFNEPGVVGTFCGLVLYVLPFNSFRLYIFIFAGIISFSLAFYVLLFMFLIFSFNLKRGLIIIGLMALFISVFGVEIFEKHILSRVGQGDEIIDDNRTSEEFDNIYDDFVLSPNVLWGDGIGVLSEMKSVYIDACSWKRFVLERGFLGFAILLIFSIWSYCSQYGVLPLKVGLLLFAYMAALYQRAGYLYGIEYFILLYSAPLFIGFYSDSSKLKK